MQQWINGEQVTVDYGGKKPDLKTEALIFGDYTIETASDLREYILNETSWYSDLLEDPDNRRDFSKWLLGFYNGDKAKLAAFDRLIKYYSQEGIDYVADAVLRFLTPDMPFFSGVKSFDIREIPDVKKITAKSFSHFLSEMWEDASDDEVRLFIFRYELFLIGQKDKFPESVKAEVILNQKLCDEKNEGENDSDYAKAFQNISKKSLPLIHAYLNDVLDNEVTIDIVELDDSYDFHFNINQTVEKYFKSLGILKMIPPVILNEVTMPSRCPEKWESLDDFISQTGNNFRLDCMKLHGENLKQHPSAFENTDKKLKNIFTDLSVKFKNEFLTLKNEYLNEISGLKGLNDEYRRIENMLSDVPYPTLHDELKKIRDIENGIVKILAIRQKLTECRAMIESFSSKSLPYLEGVEKLINTGSLNEIRSAEEIMYGKHLLELENIKDIPIPESHETVDLQNISNCVKIKSSQASFSFGIHLNPGNHLSISPYGNLVALLNSPARYSLIIINMQTGEQKFVYPQSDRWPQFVAFSPDGNYLAFSQVGNKIIIVNAVTGQILHSLYKKDESDEEDYGEDDDIFSSHMMSAPVFSPDGSYLFGEGIMRSLQWDYQTGEFLGFLDFSQPVRFHKDDNICYQHRYHLVIQDLTDPSKSWPITTEHPSRIEESCFSPDFKLIATSCEDDSVRIWNVENSELIHTLEGHDTSSRYSKNKHICFSPDCKFLASRYDLTSIRLWDVQTGNPVLTFNGFKSVSGIAFHPGKYYLAVADQNDLVIIYLKEIVTEKVEMTVPDFIQYEKETKGEILKYEEVAGLKLKQAEQQEKNPEDNKSDPVKTEITSMLNEFIDSYGKNPKKHKSQAYFLYVPLWVYNVKPEFLQDFIIWIIKLYCRIMRK